MRNTPLPSASHAGLSAQGFACFCHYITQELGIKMSDAKRPLLQSRLQRRLRALGLDTLEAYQEHVFHSAHGEEERVHFIDAITTNKTDFFREPTHFEYLTRTALPELEPARRPATPESPWHLKLWCAGCSSGEEPYTLAMVLSEFARSRPGFDFSLLATDISTRVLHHAQLGIYDEDRVAPVPLPLRTRYLLRSKDPTRAQVRVAPDLRRRVSFRRLNFMDSTYAVPERFEVIFFRNVLIYFDKPRQQDVVRKLCRHLIPGGHLFVGHSESLAGLDLPVTAVAPAIYRRRS
jgi:chemotaxis protein methyltransferase CheR